VVVDSWRTGLVLNAVVLWNTRCTEGLGGSRLGDDRGHDGGLHHLTRGQRHNGDQDERNRGPGWKQVHEQETANATIGAFPRGLPQSRSPRPAPEKAVGQEARESVNRLIVAKGPADRLAAPPAIQIAQKPSSRALNADASTAGSPGNPKPPARSRSRCPRMVCRSACLIWVSRRANAGLTCAACPRARISGRCAR
jgi:hypothetical protein